jgi:hypothetical protein
MRADTLCSLSPWEQTARKVDDCSKHEDQHLRYPDLHPLALHFGRNVCSTNMQPLPRRRLQEPPANQQVWSEPALSASLKWRASGCSLRCGPTLCAPCLLGSKQRAKLTTAQSQEPPANQQVWSEPALSASLSVSSVFLRKSIFKEELVTPLHLPS